MKKYFYIDGQEAMVGDEILAPPRKPGRVQFLLEPGSPLAQAYSAPNGGIVLEFDDEDCQMWPEADEDLRFVRRSSSH